MFLTASILSFCLAILTSATPLICGPECNPLSWNHDDVSRFEDVSDNSLLNFYSFKSVNPDAVNKNSTNFRILLYTRSNPVEPQELTVENIHESHYDGSKGTKILLHGWLSDYKSDVINNSRDAYLAKDDVNILSIDWDEVANKDYPTSRYKVNNVAERLADFIKAVVNNGSMSLNKLHMIGHSLGAHIAGVTGLRLKKWNVGTVDRITGLDPALPLFQYVSDRLGRKSASFVDVIHTTGMTLSFFEPLGHADFYPNGGVAIQPGCGLDVVAACSHGRSHEFFSESISKPDGFVATPCLNYVMWKSGACTFMPFLHKVHMGDPVDRKKAKGIYFLDTNSKKPYGKGTNLPWSFPGSDKIHLPRLMLQ